MTILMTAGRMGGWFFCPSAKSTLSITTRLVGVVRKQKMTPSLLKPVVVRVSCNGLSAKDDSIDPLHPCWRPYSV